MAADLQSTWTIMTAPIRSSARGGTLAYVAEVHELCALAGRGDFAAGLVAKATPVSQVGRALREARAAEDEPTTIRSQVRPASVEPAQPAIDTAAILRRPQSERPIGGWYA